MAVLILLLLDSWPVAYGNALLENLHTYDVLRYDVTAEPTRGGLRVDCRLTLLVERPGPLRFFLGGDVADLAVARDGQPVAAELGTGGFERVLRTVAGDVAGVPSLLEITPSPPARPGERVELHLRYRWRPEGPDWVWAREDAVQTHLSGFWLPLMAGELFEASVVVNTRHQVVAPGRRAGPRRFESLHPLQILPLVVGRFDEHTRPVGGRTLRLLLPPGLDADPAALLADLAAVLARLEEWLGPAPGEEFTLVVERWLRPAPSYCGGTFAVVHRSALADRARWLSHLAHEVSHVWWGHRVATPVVGKGGTWLREGLAQWSGVKVAATLPGGESERERFRRHFHAYIGRADLRRSARAPGVIFANETTLRDATYLDDLAVPYLRGALVLRRLEAEVGAERFRAMLASFARDHAYVFTKLEAFERATGAAAAIDYYAKTTRLPDLELRDVEAGPGRVRAEISCADPAWPGGTVNVRVKTAAGEFDHAVAMRAGRGVLDWQGEGDPVELEVDPDRIHLDPVRSNNLWRR